MREYDYGDFEGRTTAEIWQTHPGEERGRRALPRDAPAVRGRAG